MQGHVHRAGRPDMSARRAASAGEQTFWTVGGLTSTTYLESPTTSRRPACQASALLMSPASLPLHDHTDTGFAAGPGRIVPVLSVSISRWARLAVLAYAHCVGSGRSPADRMHIAALIAGQGTPLRKPVNYCLDHHGTPRHLLSDGPAYRATDTGAGSGAGGAGAASFLCFCRFSAIPRTTLRGCYTGQSLRARASVKTAACLHDLTRLRTFALTRFAAL